jgi:hypothetical protein
MRKEATAIIQVYPKGIAHAKEEYRVGAMCRIPVANMGYDEVESITIVDEWRPHVEISFKEWGDVWIVDYITEIHFAYGEYRKATGIKEFLKGLENPPREQKGSDQDNS